jgi:flagella basal body P-ring formation protein FlgA
MIAGLLLFGMMNYSGPCQTVRGDRIFGEDLAKALPIFTEMPRDAILGYSPAPGTRRDFSTAELASIGAKYHVTVPADVQTCFEWEMHPLSGAAVSMAIRDALHAPQARVDIMAMSKSPVPDGKLVFPLTGLTSGGAHDPAMPPTWTGYVLYSSGRKFDVWCRVKVSATMMRVVAVQAVQAGQVIAAGQVRLEAYDDFPVQNGIARNLDEVVGRVSRRPIRAGSPLFLADLTEPLQVQRGDLVQVTVISGGAQIALSAQAESSGRIGDLIALRNLGSQKTFRARIEGKGRALVIAEPPSLFARIQ